MSNEECRIMHAEANIREGQMCAGFSDGMIDSCDGDSGGPLVVIDENKQKRLAGIISWSQGCGRPGRPGVYTKVSHYANWIFDLISAAAIIKGVTNILHLS